MPDDPVVRFGLAGAYLEAGQAESAIIEYEETIRLKPDYSAAHRGLGRALERAGRREEAQAAYRKGLEVAARTGDLQTRKEIEVFLRRLDTAGSCGHTMTKEQFRVECLRLSPGRPPWRLRGVMGTGVTVRRV